MAKNTNNADAFVDSLEVEVSPRKRRSKTRLAITDDGIDWSAFSEEKKADVLATLGSDPYLTATLEELKKQAAPPLIQEKHINWLLDIIEAAEQYFIPKIVERKSKGMLKSNPAIARASFQFSKREKIVPAGVEAANTHLPEKIKIMITKVGSGSEFFGYLLMDLHEQQKNYAERLILEMQLEARKSPDNRNRSTDPRQPHTPAIKIPKPPPSEATPADIQV